MGPILRGLSARAPSSTTVGANTIGRRALLRNPLSASSSRTQDETRPGSAFLSASSSARPTRRGQLRIFVPTSSQQSRHWSEAPDSTRCGRVAPRLCPSRDLEASVDHVDESQTTTKETNNAHAPIPGCFSQWPWPLIFPAAGRRAGRCASRQHRGALGRSWTEILVRNAPTGNPVRTVIDLRMFLHGMGRP
jgi:hypothetical protein